MRFSHFLLIATAALLSSCNATAAVSGEGQKMTSADAAVPVRVLAANNGTRSLRYYNEEEETDKYNLKNDKYDDDEEERGVMSATQVIKWSARADEWVGQGKSPAYIKDKLTNMYGVMSAKDKQKYELFKVAWAKAHPEALGRR